MKCYECGDDGHGAWDCPNKRYIADGDVYPPRPPLRHDPAPPTADYLEARQQLNMPSSGPQILSVACPWCKAPPWRRCHNPGTGRDTDPHTARQEAAGLGQHRPSRRLRDLALRQAAESRRTRQLLLRCRAGVRNARDCPALAMFGERMRPAAHLTQEQFAGEFGI